MPDALGTKPTPKKDRIQSKAADAARERCNTSYRNQPLIQPPYDPLDPINRAKRGEEIPARESNELNPTGVADVNGEQGQDGGDKTRTPATLQNSSALPEGLTEQARASLEGAGLTTLALVAAKSDAELKSLPNVGDKSIEVIRAEAARAGLTSE